MAILQEIDDGVYSKTNNNDNNNNSDDQDSNDLNIDFDIKSNNLYNHKNNLTNYSDNELSMINNLENMNNVKPLRVLIFNESFYPYTSGISRRFIEIITRLAKKKFKIHLLTGTENPDGWIKDECIREYITFGCLRSIAFQKKIDCNLPFLYPQPGIWKEIKKFKPDVIHVVEHTPAAILCGTIAKILDIPLVCSSHTHLDSYIPLFIHKFAYNLSLRVYRYARKSFLNLADCNLTVSTDFAEILRNSGIKSKVHVWKTGVDSELFNPKYRSHEMRLKMFNGHYSEDKILLVSVGRISAEKNFEFLLEVIEKFPKTFLCIVGDGPYRVQIENIFPKDRAHFIGFLGGEELASAYASGDYFIYASVSETFGQVYLEAMSCGVPVVAAEGKHMKEFFVNGQHGYTWIPGDVESACKSFSNTIENHDKLSKNCRSNALNHSWNHSAEQIIDLYSQFNSHKQEKSFYKTAKRFLYYGTYYVFIMLLALILLAPFVTRPTTTKTTTENIDKKKKSSYKKNNEFITNKLYNESNRICGAFIAVCLSLIFTSILAMINGKLSIGYIFAFFH